MSKQLRKNIITFADLPPRVIIYDLLSFYEHEIKEYEKKFLSLFGYFKKDRYRNAWMMYTSLFFSRLYKSFTLLNVLVDSSKIFSLRIQWPGSDMFEKLTKLSSKMKNLRKLDLHLPSSPYLLYLSKKWRDDFFFNCRFPMLVSFYIEYQIPTLYEREHGIRRAQLVKFGERFHECQNLFSCLESLEMKNLSVCSYGNENSFFKNKIFFSELSSRKKIRSLDLLGVSLDKETRVEFLSLERVSIESVKNLVIIPGPNVQFAALSILQKEDFEPLLQKSPNLKSLIIRNRDNSSGHCWFLDQYDCSFNKLEKLHFSDYGRGVFRKNRMNREARELRFVFNSDDIINFRLLSTLRDVVISQESFSEVKVDVFNNTPFPNLEKLEICCHKTIVNLNPQNVFNWIISINLKVLRIRGRIYGELIWPDSLFRKNQWPKLEILEIGEGMKIHKSQRWNPMLCLKKLKISCCSLNDEFLKLNTFPQLEYLSIFYCLEIEGFNWNRETCSGIKTLIFSNCRKIKDVLFTETEFKNLERLTLDKMESLKGDIKWKSFENLKTLYCHPHYLNYSTLKWENIVNNPVEWKSVKDFTWEKKEKKASRSFMSLFSLIHNLF